MDVVDDGFELLGRGRIKSSRLGGSEEHNVQLYSPHSDKLKGDDNMDLPTCICHMALRGQLVS